MQNVGFQTDSFLRGNRMVAKPKKQYIALKLGLASTDNLQHQLTLTNYYNEKEVQSQ